MKSIIKLFIISNILFASFSAIAQQDAILDQSVKDVYTVVGFGACGAILGLSTLSFVEEPGDHLKNIIVGGAIGVIIGVGIVAYLYASRSRELYQNYSKIKHLDGTFSTHSRLQWHTDNFNRWQLANDQNAAPNLTYSFDF